MNSIFEYENHFLYLNDVFHLRQKTRGAKGRFANYTQIQPAYLSQVLAHKYPLSLEQADLANSFLEHTLDESDFFLLLVSRDRAGSVSLKKHYTKQIESFRKKRLEVVERLGRRSEISSAVQGVYYSSWIYSAVHVALTIPNLQKLSNLEKYLGLNREVLLKVLNFLEESQFIIKEKDEFRTTKNWIRLDRTSPHIQKLHTNWRQQAIQSLDSQKETDLHFSGVYSLDSKTAKIIHEALLQSLSNNIKKIETAEEKELYVLNMDFFELNKSL